MNSSPAHIPCPTCRKPGDWFATHWAPFCSRRCKLIDLGKWLEGEHVISEPLGPESLEEYVDLSTPDRETNPVLGEN